MLIALLTHIHAAWWQVPDALNPKPNALSPKYHPWWQVPDNVQQALDELARCTKHAARPLPLSLVRSRSRSLLLAYACKTLH